MLRDGKLFGKWNPIDGFIVAVLALCVLGAILVYFKMHVTSGQMVTGESDIVVTVEIPKLATRQPDLFKPQEKTAITIRNQPRGEVRIESVESQRTQAQFWDPATKSTQLTPDQTLPNSYDFRVTLRDHALVSPDGYVAEGVKVKIGLPIELEGQAYRVYGKIIDVKAAP